MAKRPGGALASRPLNFFWLVDGSGSMSSDGKIRELNRAVRESLPEMRAVAAENPHARLLIRALRFSHGARWHVQAPTPVESLVWEDIEADPLEQPKVDVVFLVDTSGSMGDEIEAVKASCIRFAKSVARDRADVRLGLLGFSIGGHRGSEISYRVANLSRYTLGTWPLAAPSVFEKSVQSLEVGLFGFDGCYLLDSDTTDLVPHIVAAFGPDEGRRRFLVVISDEKGGLDAQAAFVEAFKAASIIAFVLGVPTPAPSSHMELAAHSGGQFWDITANRGRADFRELLDVVAERIAREVTVRLADGSLSSGTDMGAALRLLGEQLSTPPMPDKALPPVAILISDGRPSDDFHASLDALMKLPWAQKTVRLAIAIGGDADPEIMRQFIGNRETPLLRADGPEDLLKYVRWASTVVVRSVSKPAKQALGSPAATPAPVVLEPSPAASIGSPVWKK